MVQPEELATFAKDITSRVSSLGPGRGIVHQPIEGQSRWVIAWNTAWYYYAKYLHQWCYNSEWMLGSPRMFMAETQDQTTRSILLYSSSISAYIHLQKLGFYPMTKLRQSQINIYRFSLCTDCVRVIVILKSLVW